MTVFRRKIVGVMGSGTRGYPHLARPLGELIAASGHHLLTGGGSGVMAEVSRAFCDVEGRAGLALGIIRSADLPRLDDATGRRAWTSAAVNDWVEIPILTHLPLSSQAPLSRNHINVLTADALVALPGSSGTLSEVRLRLQYGRSVIVYLGEAAAGLSIGGLSAEELEREARGGASTARAGIAVAENLEEVRRHLLHALDTTAA